MSTTTEVTTGLMRYYDLTTPIPGGGFFQKTSLQQQWRVTIKDDNDAIVSEFLEWRDVPTVKSE